jgi:NAD(P)-dependent dehydrogenase (short-subunit alcohol dehydrogenase family)
MSHLLYGPVDLKPRKIRVNVLSPGTIDTALFDGLSEAKDAFVAMIPRGTIGRPEEIATAALFLRPATPASSPASSSSSTAASLRSKRVAIDPTGARSLRHPHEGHCDDHGALKML